MTYTDKIYGTHQINGVFEAIIQTAVFQRLQKIHQGGVIVLSNPYINQTRYEHSIGVMLLIRYLGGSQKEQIAGLIHDISHTAFSHLIDYVLDNESEDYHEHRYMEVLQDKELVQVLEKFGFDWKDFVDVTPFQLLEYPLPDLCADRIDYTLRDLFQINYLSLADIGYFLKGLTVFDNRIVLKSVDYAIWFKGNYEYLVSAYFGSQENISINQIMKTIVQECLQKSIISIDDFHKDDLHLIQKINQYKSLDNWIKELKSTCLSTTLTTKKRTIQPAYLEGHQLHYLK